MDDQTRSRVDEPEGRFFGVNLLKFICVVEFAPYYICGLGNGKR